MFTFMSETKIRQIIRARVKEYIKEAVKDLVYDSYGFNEVSNAREKLRREIQEEVKRIVFEEPDHIAQKAALKEIKEYVKKPKFIEAVVARINKVQLKES